MAVSGRTVEDAVAFGRAWRLPPGGAVSVPGFLLMGKGNRAFGPGGPASWWGLGRPRSSVCNIWWVRRSKGGMIRRAFSTPILPGGRVRMASGLFGLR